MISGNERAAPHAALLLLAGALLAPLPAPAADAPPAARTAGEMERLRSELAATRRELSDTKHTLEATQGALAELSRRVDALASGAAPLVPAPVAQTARLAPVNVDNPAVSFVVDTSLASDTESSWDSIGFPDGSDFALLSGELFLSAPIDPFLRGYASINATSEEGFDVEEAALVTTSLPWNLTAKGGRFFANVGRLSSWHDEALPFVDRPPSLERLVGGESGSEGLEVSWLAPFDQFLELTGGVYDAVGEEALEELNEDGFFGRRSASELNFLVRPHTYVDLTHALGVELGGTWLTVPHEHTRSLYGADLTVRHQPGTSGRYQGLVWGSEWLWNDEEFTERDDLGAIIDQSREHRQGGYTYVEAFFARRYSAGFRFDYSEAAAGDEDLARTWSVFATWRSSEFQRLRVQLDTVSGAQPSNQRFTVQWTAFLGSHRHGFAQR